MLNKKRAALPTLAGEPAPHEPAPGRSGRERRPARERLLEAADELFYREGINNVGIDRVLEHAATAKASLYATFGSKEELVRAYLVGRHERRRARIEAAIAEHRTARDQLLAVFDALAQALAQPGYRGCAFMKARSELPQGEGARDACDLNRQWMRNLFLRLVQEAQARNPALVARQLALLYDGAVIAAQMDGDVAAAQTARQTAAELLDAAIPANAARADPPTRS